MATRDAAAGAAKSIGDPALGSRRAKLVAVLFFLRVSLLSEELVKNCAFFWCFLVEFLRLVRTNTVHPYAALRKPRHQK